MNVTKQLVLASSVASLLAFAGSSAKAAATSWNGSADALWDTGLNWSLSAKPTAADDIIFPNPVPATGSTITLTAGELGNSLQFDAGYTLTGGNLTLTSGNVTVSPTVTATINSVLLGTTGVNKLGTGTLILGGTNTFTGTSTVTAGVLQYAADANLGAAAAAVTVDNNATLRYSTTAAAATNNHLITIGAGGATFEITNTQMYFNVANKLAGTGTLTVKGGATPVQYGGNLRLATAQSGFTGSLNIGAGASVEYGIANAVPASVPITVNGDGTGNFATSGEFAVNNALTASNAITANGGIFSANGGTSTISGPVSIGSAGLVVGLRDWYNFATVRSMNISGALTGTGGLLVNSGTGAGGTLTLSNTGNTFSGNTTITSSTVAATGGSLGTGTITLGGTNAVLAWGTTQVDQTLVNRITTGSTGAIALGGVSTANNIDFSAYPNLSLGATGTATYSGTLTPGGTTYRLGGGGGTLILANANAVTGARDLLVGNGSGTVILANNNDYTGNTTINAGTALQIGNGGVTGSFNTAGGLTINGTLSFNRADNVTFSSPFTGTATINQAGISTLKLAAPSNAYPRLALSNSGRIDIGANTVTVGFDGGNLIQATGTAIVANVDATGGGKIQLNSNNGDIGAAANSRLIINAPIVNGTGSAVDIYNAGLGTVVFNGANTYTGATNVQGGNLVATSLNSVVGGTASSSLGAPTTVANGTINISTGTTAAGLIYVGAGETTDRVVNLLGTTGGATLDQSGSGVLTFSSNFTASGGGIKTLTLQGSTSGSGVVAGSIVNNTGTNTTALVKAGSGTWTLRGGTAGNTYTGATTVNGGTLALDFVNATPQTNIVSASSQLVLGGGRLSVLGKDGGTNSQTFASTVLNAGGSSVAVISGATNSTVVALGNITRNTGSTVSFIQPTTALSATNGITTTTALNASGILGGYATVGADWAMKDSSNHPIAYAGYTSADLSGAATATTNYKLSGGGTLGAATAMNSLRIDDTGAAQSLVLGTSNLTLSGSGGAGGLMYAGGTSNAYTISGGTGTLTAGANDLIISTPNAGTNLTVSAIIAGSGGLTKSGDGTLLLTNTANTFTGNVWINGGTLAINAPVANAASADSALLGAGNPKLITLSNGATFTMLANGANNSYNPTGGSKYFVMGSGGGVLDMPTGVTLTLDDGTGNGTGTTNAQLQGSGKLTKRGGGTIQLGYSGQAAGSFQGFTGDIVIEAGLVQAGLAGALGSSSVGTTTVQSGATLEFYSAANATYGETITINGSGLSNTGALRLASAVSANLNGPITLGSDSSIGNSSTGNLLINGSVSGPGALTKVGTGLVTLAGVNSYTGATNVDAGTLKLQRPVSLPNGSLVNVGAGATLLVSTGGAGEYQASDITALLGNSGFGGNTASFGLDTSNAAGPITTAAISGGFGFTKSGTGTLVIPASTYTGATTITGGTLQLGADNALPNTGLNIGANGVNAGSLDLGAYNQTVPSLTVSTNNSTTANTINIAAGKTLTVNGNVAIGNTTATGTTAKTILNFTGGGALVVNSPGGTFQAGLNVGTTNNSAIADVNMAALSSVDVNLGSTGTFAVQPNGDNRGGGSIGGTVTLSDTANSITAANLNVGVSSTGSLTTLLLGNGTNVLNANVVNLGTGGRDTGVLKFASAGAGSVNLRNAAGTGRVNTVTLGPTTAQGTAYTTASVFDTTGHSADLAIGTLQIDLGAKTGANTNDFKFDSGTLDIRTINMAVAKGTGTSINTIAIGGGNVFLGGSAAFGDAGTGTVTLATAAQGELAITGGTVTSSVDILRGAATAGSAAILTLDGGKLDMSGKNIGGAVPIDTLNLRSGTLSNVAQINGGANITKTGGDILTLAGVNSYTGATNVNSGTLVVSGSLTGSIVNLASGTLSGSGSITNALNLGDSLGGSGDAILSPGTGIGTLTAGPVTFANDVIFSLQINSTAKTTDLLSSTGPVSLGLGVVALNTSDLGNAILGNQTFTFISGTSVTGQFAGLANGSQFTVGPNTFTINYTPTSVMLVSVPEPSAVMSILGGLGSLMGLTRFRRRRLA